MSSSFCFSSPNDGWKLLPPQRHKWKVQYRIVLPCAKGRRMRLSNRQNVEEPAIQLYGGIWSPRHLRQWYRGVPHASSSRIPLKFPSLSQCLSKKLSYTGPCPTILPRQGSVSSKTVRLMLPWPLQKYIQMLGRPIQCHSLKALDLPKTTGTEYAGSNRQDVNILFYPGVHVDQPDDKILHLHPYTPFPLHICHKLRLQ